MNKRILQEIKKIENFLLLEAMIDLLKDIPGFGKLFSKEGKSAAEIISSLFRDAKYIKPEESKAFGRFFRNSKELNPEELAELTKRGIDVDALKRDSIERIKGLLEARRAGRELTSVDRKFLQGHISEIEKATKEIESIKGGKKPVPTVEPKPTPTTTVEPKPSPTDITDAMTEPGVRSLSREQQAYINQLKDAMKSEDPQIAAEATRQYKEIMFPHIAKETSVPVKNQKEIAKRIEEIQKELKSYEGTELQYSKRAKELQKELDSITGTGYGAKLRNWCRNNKKTCLIVGIPLTALTGYGVYKAGQALGIIGQGTTPTPGPKPPPAGRGRGCRGGVAKSCPDTELKYGCVGENVKPIQQQLIDCGFPLPKFGVDGKFCAETKAATEAFQRKAGIKVDGVAGTDTQEALKKCNVSKTPEPEQPVEPKLMPVPPEEPPKITGGTIGGGDIQENINRFNIIKNRHEKLEKLVFERLVKGCK